MTPASTLSTARTFHRGFELCHGNGLPASNGELNALVPSVVCLAFAIELALKSLLQSTGKPSNGHKLAELFDLLPEEERQAVIHHSGVQAQSFRENLRVVSNAFVEWRYIYERPGSHTISVQFLLMLWNGVRAVSESKVAAQRGGAK